MEGWVKVGGLSVQKNSATFRRIWWAADESVLNELAKLAIQKYPTLHYYKDERGTLKGSGSSWPPQND